MSGASRTDQRLITNLTLRRGHAWPIAELVRDQNDIHPTTLQARSVMSKNRGVVYTRPGEVQVQDIADPKFENPEGRKIEHGVILKVVSTNICGSDQHMVRGRTTAPAGMVLGHEITGEV